MKNSVLLVLSLVYLTGCQALKEEHRRQMATLCTYDGAFSKGVKDAEEQTGSNAIQTMSPCSPELKAMAIRGYNHGYASITSTKPVGVNGPVGNFLNDVLEDSVAKGNLFNCEINLFSSTYSAQGKSKEEALFNAKQKCTNQRHDGDFFCKNETEYSCSKLY